MSVFDRAFPTTRRRTLQVLGLLGLGGTGVARSAGALAATAADAEDAWPKMTYRKLGKTGFEGSRLVFGCGAALMFWSRDELLELAFEHGVNVFDVGTSDYYRSAENNLASFARKRRDDILPIANHFMSVYSRKYDKEGCAFSSAAEKALLEYDWPGNVRELKSVMARAVVLNTTGVIDIDDLGGAIRDHIGEIPGPTTFRDQMTELEVAAIRAALAGCEGNQTQAAKRLGLSRRTLIYRMEKYGLKPPPPSRG